VLAEAMLPSQPIDNPDVPIGRKRFIPLGMSLPNLFFLFHVFREINAKLSEQRIIRKS